MMPAKKIARCWLLFAVLILPLLVRAQQITGFSPSTITAGTGNVLTIYGTGFGTKNSFSYVEFRDANSGGSAFISPIDSEYILWTTTQIQINVPSRAGSGTFRVVVNGTTVLSNSSITIPYNLSNATFSGRKYRVNLTNINILGGYTYLFNNSFNNNTAARASFLRAFNSWICATAVNWRTGGSTSNNSTNRDGANVVRFDDDLDVGTLATTYSYYNGYTSGAWYLTEVDMSFSTYYSWSFGPQAPASNTHDFETVTLHELGHAHNLGHVINTADVMHYAISAGSMRRTLNSDDIAGGNFVMDYSKIPVSGSAYSPVIPIDASFCASTNGPTISSFSPTTAGTGSIVTIIGTNLLNVSSVSFGGISASSFNVVSPTSITAVVGTGATGNVSVSNSFGTATRAGFTFFIKSAQTITFPILPSKVYGDADFDPAAISSSGLPVTYASNNSNVATIINNKIHITGAGSALITASQSGDNSFVAAPTISRTLTVARGSQTIVFPNIATKNYGDPDFDPGASSTSGLPISYTSSDTDIATIINNKVHITGIGTVTLTASQVGDTNYNPALPINNTLTVVYPLPINNFKVQANDKTCRTTNNGTIIINATQTLNYNVSIKSINQTTSYTFGSILEIKDLSAGNYTVCITITGVNNYKQCFDLTIREPKDLSVFAAVTDDDKFVNLQLQGGTFYKIEMNGKTYTTNEQEIVLPLINGTNAMKITTNALCQGVIEKTFITNPKIIAYPNPFTNSLSINTGTIEDKKVNVQIFTLTGSLVYSANHQNEAGKINLNLPFLNNGFYILQLTIGNTKSILKVVKAAF